MKPNSQTDMPQESLEIERLKLDRENAQRDFALRERELDFKMRELQLKEIEKKSSSFKNPLFLALVAAIVGLFGNIANTMLQNHETMLMTQSKNDADLRLAEQKSKSDLILEAIKTGDPKKAQRNLLFFLQAGLIEDPKGSIQKTAELQSPSLPSSNPRHIFNSSAGPLEAQVGGTITDSATGLPISGANVNFATAGGVVQGHTDDTSQSDGRYQVDIFYPLTYQVTVTAAGYNSQSRKLLLKQSRQDGFDFSLTPTTKQ